MRADKMNTFLMEEKALKDRGFEGRGGLTCDGEPWVVDSACPDCKMIRYSNGCIVTDCDCGLYDD